MVGRLVPFWAAAPKGSMTYAFTHMGNFLLLLLLLLLLGSGVLAGIWPLRLRFGPQGWDMGLEAEIWASWLGGGGCGGEEGGGEEEGENPPYV